MAGPEFDDALLDLLACEHGTLTNPARARVLRRATEEVEEALARLRRHEPMDHRGRLSFERRIARLRGKSPDVLRKMAAAIVAESPRPDVHAWLRDLALGLLADDDVLRAQASQRLSESYDTYLQTAPEILAFERTPAALVYGAVGKRAKVRYAAAASRFAVDELDEDVVPRLAFGAPEEPLPETPEAVLPLRALRAFFEAGPRALEAFEPTGADASTRVVASLASWLRGDVEAKHAIAKASLGASDRSVPVRFFVGLARLASGKMALERDVRLPRGADEALRFGARLRDDAKASVEGWLPREEGFWSTFAYSLVQAAFVADVDQRRRAAEPLRRAVDSASHVPWLAHQTNELFDVLHGSRAARCVFLDLLDVEPPWKRTLRRVQAVLGDGDKASSKVRFVWDVDAAGDGTIRGLGVREQRKSKTGWSRGRQMHLGRMVRGALPAETPDEDRALFAALAPTKRGGFRYLPSDDVWIHDAHFVEALVGHARITRRGRGPLSVRRGSARLAVTEDADGFVVAIEPRGSGLLDRTTHFEAVVLDARQTEAANALDGAFALPLEARDEVERLVSALSPLFTVDAAADLTLDAVEDVAADPTLRVRLRRDAGVVGFDLVVTPLGPEGPAMHAGEGLDVVIAQGRRTTRNRRAEVLARSALFAACPTLGGRDRGVCTLDATLDLLAELRDAEACVEWREGSPLRVELAQGTLALRTALRDDWLVPTGGLEHDGTLIATFEALLDAVRGERRFVQLDDARYLELTASLRRAVQRLDAFTDGDLLHPLVALLESPEIDLRGLDEERVRLREAMSAPVAVPRTLEAELRGYQVEGFVWMARLCRAGLGACLADDMGLGKTVQTLALLLDRAKEGPALVVAPTSVLAGWRDEAARFAPSLRVHVVGAGVGAEAEALVRDAGPFDVVLTSYGMLPSRGELFASRAWTTAVLDEAQVIKNATTQTARAAHRLRADARVALSGTPVENHLGELWSLFRFLVPGLLGSRRSFQGNFVKGVADVEGHAFKPGYPGRKLRDRVRPFVLRREKRDVLRELPPRTELVLRVEPSAAQRAFLEALRRKDVRTLVDAKDQRFALLAALMRQRRACCAPTLVAPRTKVASAKLEAFFELVDELREGGHRALVFSQFVDLLSLVRATLDERAIPYRYLDGSTTPKQREREVSAFQDGEGDLFLISLKAGGTGLNLTAADYVVHLDPWWNPAAEDQASDRAHRIGQTRPVTVYRLVLEGSVEEKILELHERKRGLAEGLLANADDADVRVDLETLERLLRE
ncbi:MAG: DEAD/DEAH box helicase [Polyangiales bacterium]